MYAKFSGKNKNKQKAKMYGVILYCFHVDCLSVHNLFCYVLCARQTHELWKWHMKRHIQNSDGMRTELNVAAYLTAVKSHSMRWGFPEENLNSFWIYFEEKIMELNSF